VANIDLHKNQLQAYLSKKRVVALIAGIQGGKTFAGALWLRRQVGIFNNEGDNFLITTPNYKIFSQSTLPAFLAQMKGFGHYDKKNEIFKLSRNRSIYLRSMVDPDSIEGVTNVRAIWGDEAGKMSKKAWVNMQGRAAFKEAQIFLTTTPYSLNWLFKEVYRPWVANERDDVELVQFKSIDNPHFPKEEFDRQKELMDSRTFAMKYEGTFQRMAGLVYPDFNEEDNYCEMPDLHQRDDWHIVAGVDWGYTNQFAIVVRAIHKFKKIDVQIDEYYERFQTADDKVKVGKLLQHKWKIESFFCDNNEPATIDAYNRDGLNAIACKKYKGSLEDGIQEHATLIKTKYYKIVAAACPNTIDEYEMYHYPEDKGDEENVSDKPVSAADHLMSANMYCSQGSRGMRQERYKNERGHLVKKSHRDLLSEVASCEGDWYTDAVEEGYDQFNPSEDMYNS